MKSIDLKYIVIPWGLTGIFLFIFYQTIYFPLDKSFQQIREYIDKQHYDLAILKSSDIITTFPNHQAGHFLRGYAYFRKGHWDDAIVDYNQILRMQCETPQAYFRRGNVYLRKGDYDRAIDDYNQGLRFFIISNAVYLNRSKAYFAKREYIKSLEDMHQARSLGVPIATAYIKELENAAQTR